MKAVASLLCAVLMSFTSSLAQQPSPPPSEQPPLNQQGSKERAIPSFLILGTVFNESALSFARVQVRIRRKDEKKFRWETYTNSRGEFAVRVFPGYEYEVVTHVKKYQDQSHDVDAKVDVQQRLSIKLQPANHPGAALKP